MTIFTHRCLTCRSPWYSTFRKPLVCLFCGGSDITSRRANVQ